MRVGTRRRRNGAIAPGAISTDVIIFAYGQSNEVGTNGTAAQTIFSNDQNGSGRILEWEVGVGAPVTAVQPLHWRNPVAFDGQSRAFRLAQNLLPRLAASKKIIIIPAAISGHQLTGGPLAAPNGADYTGAKIRLAAAIAAYPGAQVIMDMTQGEADGNVAITGANYKTAFATLVADLRAMTGNSGMLVFVHQMVPEVYATLPPGDPDRAVIDAAHKQLPMELTNTLFIGSTLGYQMSGDASHFTGYGHRTAGDRAARAYDWVTYLSNNAPATPTGLADASTASLGQISFVTPAIPAPCYVLETKPTAGGVWTETLLYPTYWNEPGATQTFDCPGSGSTSVRIRSRSKGGDSARSAQITAAVPATGWWRAKAVVDLDFENTRFYVNGVEYASKAAMVTAGFYVIDVTGDECTLTGLIPAAYTLIVDATTDVAAAGTGRRYPMALDTGSGGSTSLVYFDRVNPSGTTREELSIFTSGVNQTSALIYSGAQSIAVATRFKEAARIKANDVVWSLAGQTIQTDTVSPLPAVTRLIVGNRSDQATVWPGTVHRLTLINDVYSNALLVSTTA